MSYVKRIVCLANSYKTGGRCIAGREVLAKGKYGGWIRPVSARPSEELSNSEYRYEENGIPKLLDIIDVPLLKAAPNKHQTENHIIDVDKRWVKKGELQWNELEKLRERPASLWINSDCTQVGVYNCMSPAEAETLDHSLLLIKKSKFVVELAPKPWSGNRNYGGKFKYRGTSYNFSITDPEARRFFRQEKDGDHVLTDVYLCISLTEPYATDNRCHKLVAAMISDPPL